MQSTFHTFSTNWSKNYAQNSASSNSPLSLKIIRCDGWIAFFKMQTVCLDTTQLDLSFVISIAQKPWNFSSNRNVCVHLNNKMYKEFSRKKCEFSVRNFLVNSQFFLWFWWIIWIFRPRITFLYLIVSKTAPLILEFFTVPRAMNCRVGENGGLSKVSKFISSTPPTHDMISTGASSFQEGNPMQKLSLE